MQHWQHCSLSGLLNCNYQSYCRLQSVPSRVLVTRDDPVQSRPVPDFSLFKFCSSPSRVVTCSYYKMAIESKDWRIICPFCLRIFNVPVNHLSNQRSSFAKDPANALSSKHEKKDSRLILIDDDMFVIGRYINYHLHCCTTCITESDSDKGEVMCLSMCPGQLFVPLKHSTLIATPLVPDLMCQPCNHLYWPHHRSW